MNTLIVNGYSEALTTEPEPPQHPIRYPEKPLIFGLALIELDYQVCEAAKLQIFHD